MQIFREIQPFRALLVEKHRAEMSVGFVPTMGALHQGHLALLEASKSQNDLTVCSIYVNPAQFNNAEDLKNYPRSLQKDADLLQDAGCDVLLAPATEEMYHGDSLVTFDFSGLDRVMEGEHRPGHFNGVALVVSKLFNIVNPTRAYFGQKDWQQCCIIHRLVNELKFNVDVQIIPTVREEDGLALSSRNLRLDQAQRKIAAHIPQLLLNAKALLRQGALMADVKNQVKAQADAAGLQLEYFELADSVNLSLLDRVDESVNPILCIAAFVGDVRLIDNMFLFDN